jgi:hypothetical protein
MRASASNISELARSRRPRTNTQSSSLRFSFGVGSYNVLFRTS